jgi:hypothetical protein
MAYPRLIGAYQLLFQGFFGVSVKMAGMGGLTKRLAFFILGEWQNKQAL